MKINCVFGFCLDDYCFGLRVLSVAGVVWQRLQDLEAFTTLAAEPDHRHRSVDAPIRIRVKSDAGRHDNPIMPELWNVLQRNCEGPQHQSEAPHPSCSGSSVKDVFTSLFFFSIAGNLNV